MNNSKVQNLLTSFKYISLNGDYIQIYPNPEQMNIVIFFKEINDSQIRFSLVQAYNPEILNQIKDSFKEIKRNDDFKDFEIHIRKNKVIITTIINNSENWVSMVKLNTAKILLYLMMVNCDSLIQYNENIMNQ